MQTGDSEVDSAPEAACAPSSLKDSQKADPQSSGLEPAVGAKTVSSHYQGRGSSKRISNRITPAAFGVSEFQGSLSQLETESLESALSRAIIFFLEHDRPVWLEGIGILNTEKVTHEKSRILGGSVIVRPETRRVVTFEKCNELVAYHYERFGGRDRSQGIIETKQLAVRTYAILPIELQLRWSEAELARVVRGFLRVVKHEVVVNGFSTRLSALGDLCALHNRRGDSIGDWYAGADIFMVPKYRQVIKVGPARVFPRPKLENAWEWLAAAHGAPLVTFDANLTAELLTLGFPLSSAEHSWALDNNRLKIAVFRSTESKAHTAKSENSKQREQKITLIYCTDGLRYLSSDPDNRASTPSANGRSQSKTNRKETTVGCELTFQLELTPSEWLRLSETPPHWPGRVLTMGWVLLCNNDGSLLPGYGFSCNAPIVPPSSFEPSSQEAKHSVYRDGAHLSSAVLSHQLRTEYRGVEEFRAPKRQSELSAIFTTQFGACKQILLGEGSFDRNDGLDRDSSTKGEQETGREFRFVNLVGITEAEAKIAEQLSPKYLEVMLKHRGLDQVTKLQRPSLVAGSHYEAPALGTVEYKAKPATNGVTEPVSLSSQEQVIQ